MEYSDNETCFQRSWSDTKNAWSDWRFWLVEVFIGGAIAMVEPFMALLFVAGIAIAVWFGATVRAPVVQRNEARLGRDDLHRKLEIAIAENEAKDNEISEITKRVRLLEEDNNALASALVNECPVWIHEESGATVIGKGDGPIQVQGGRFPYGLRPNGDRIMITGASIGGPRR